MYISFARNVYKYTYLTKVLIWHCAGVVGHCLQSANSDGHQHHGTEKDMALLGYEVLECELGIKTATSWSRRRETSIPVPVSRSQDCPWIHWGQHLALIAKRQRPTRPIHVCETNGRRDQQPKWVGFRNYGSLPRCMSGCGLRFQGLGFKCIYV